MKIGIYIDICEYNKYIYIKDIYPCMRITYIYIHIYRERGCIVLQVLANFKSYRSWCSTKICTYITMYFILYVHKIYIYMYVSYVFCLCVCVFVCSPVFTSGDNLQSRWPMSI